MNTENFYNKEILIQELSVSEFLLKNEEFDELNIIGNRIMENSLFSSEYRLSLSGFFIKELSFLYRKLFTSSEPKAFQTSKTLGENFIKKLINIIEEELDEERLWMEYNVFRIKILDSLRTEYEKKYYQDNIKFSDHVAKYLMNFLKDNPEIPYIKNSQVFIALNGIFERVFRVHSGSLSFTLIKSYIKMLENLNEYLLVKYIDGEELDSESLKNELCPFVEFISKIVENYEVIDIKEFSKKFWEIIKSWRLYYMHYKNIGAPILGSRPTERIIKLPEKTKKIIEESLKESIGKKI